MSFWTAAAVVTSAVVGSRAASKAAKSQAAAQQNAADTQAESFRFYQPYLEDVIDQGTAALDDQLTMGYYQGQTRAGMTDPTRQGLQYGFNQAQGLGSVPNNLMAASGGFANNYSNLYNRAADLNSDGNYAATALNQATAYGMESPQAQAMVDNIMRDETRRLYEGQLPTLDRQASRSGNANSSAAAVAKAVAERGYFDRRADVQADVADKLTGRFLNQRNADIQAAANINDSMGNTYNNAFKMIPALADMQVSAGDRMQAERQGVLDDARARFEGQRDFRMDMLNAYNSGILNQAVRQSPQNPIQVTASPSAAGFGGAMQGVGFGLEALKTYKDYKGA